MGNFYMEATQINYRRDEKLKTVDQKLQELSETSAIDTDIAPVFKSTNTYQPGDMVYYRNKLYVFNVEHTGAWAAADVTATDVTTELSSLNSNLINVADDVKLNTQDLTTPSRSKNILEISIEKLKENNNTGTWNGNTYSIAGVSFVCTVDNGYVSAIECSGNTSTYPALNISIGKLKAGKYKISMEDRFRLYEDGTQIYDSYGQADYAFNANGTSTYAVALYRGTGELPSKTYHPMVRLATITDPTFAPYIPSVESRIEAVENKIKTDTFSGTTDAYGNVDLNNYRYILTAYAGGYICIPFEYNYNRYIKVLSTTTFEPVTNTNVSGSYTYINS